MRITLSGFLAAAFVLVGASGPAFAHHQFGVEFDANSART